MNRPRLILFPGVGSDERLLSFQRQIDADIETPRWLEPHRRESLAAYARRMAGTIDTARPFFLGGVSFGGMLACEMVQHLEPHVRGLILLASARSNAGVPWAYRCTWRAARLIPAGLLKQGHLTVPFVRNVFGIARSDHAELFAQMLRDTDASFLKWSLEAVMHWPGPQQPLRVPVLHIHGERDCVLPPRDGVDHLVRGAGHVMNVSHAEEVNRVLQEWLQR